MGKRLGSLLCGLSQSDTCGLTPWIFFLDFSFHPRFVRYTCYRTPVNYLASNLQYLYSTIETFYTQCDSRMEDTKRVDALQQHGRVVKRSVRVRSFQMFEYTMYNRIATAFYDATRKKVW